MNAPVPITNPAIEHRLLSAIAQRGKFTDGNLVLLDDQDWYILSDRQVTDVFKIRQINSKAPKEKVWKKGEETG